MRVLVVEDDRPLGDALRRGLQAEGYAVDVSRDGQDGLWRAIEQPYDAIVLDIMLPRMNGFEVCAGVRAAGNWTPILMLTAKDGEFDEAEALDTGADDYLSKPFSFVVLLAHLRALFRRGARERPAVLVTSDLSLDPATRAVHRGTEPIQLTAREFALLEYFMRHPGVVVSKSELLANVWKAEWDVDSNLVEVYVSYLRRKIDVASRFGTIETVRGVGYRLRKGE